MQIEPLLLIDGRAVILVSDQVLVNDGDATATRTPYGGLIIGYADHPTDALEQARTTLQRAIEMLNLALMPTVGSVT